MYGQTDLKGTSEMILLNISIWYIKFFARGTATLYSELLEWLEGSGFWVDCTAFNDIC